MKTLSGCLSFIVGVLQVFDVVRCCSLLVSVVLCWMSLFSVGRHGLSLPVVAFGCPWSECWLGVGLLPGRLIGRVLCWLAVAGWVGPWLVS